MKSNIDVFELPADLSQRIEVALRHSRLSWVEDHQLEQESEIAWEVLEELNCR